MPTLFDTWFDAVEAAFARDRWLADRYEAKSKVRASHERQLAEALSAATFTHLRPRNYALIGKASCRADGLVAHQAFPGKALRYELKSIYLPHYTRETDWHNDDFARLLRRNHPNGALHDIDRLRSMKTAAGRSELAAFLLVAITWSSRAGDLREHERHRDALVQTFRRLARLPSAHRVVAPRGNNGRWSARIMAWRL